MDAAEKERIIKLITQEVLRSLNGRFRQDSSCAQKSDCPCGKPSEGNSDQGSAYLVEESFSGRVLAEESVRSMAAAGVSRILLKTGTLITPLASDTANTKGIELKYCDEVFHSIGPPEEECKERRVLLIAPRCGSTGQKAVIEAASSSGYSVEVEPVAVRSTAGAIDRIVQSIAQLKENGSPRGVVVDENVYSIAHQISRIEGIRPAICWDLESAVQSRREGGSNVLLLNYRLLGLSTINRIVNGWLNA